MKRTFLAAVAACALGTACHAPPAQSPKATAVEVPRPARADLSGIADGLGALRDVRPLAPEMPAALRAPLESGLARFVGDRARLDAAKERLAKLEQVRTWNADVVAYGLPDGSRPVVDVLEALILLEPIALGDGPLAEAARDDAFRVYFLATVLGRLVTTSISFNQSVEVYLRERGHTANLQAGFLDDFLGMMRDRGDALHRVLAAKILRAGPASAVPRVLSFLASDKEMDEAYDAALPLREEAVRQVGARASAADWANLAEAYARTGDVARAGAAAARARAVVLPGDGDGAKQAASADRIVARAATLERLSGATTLEDRLAHARAAYELGLTARARDEFEALRTRWPRDARARTGLALAIMGGFMAHAEIGTMRSAWRELDVADVEHADAEYYGLAVGLFSVRTFNELTSVGGDEQRALAGLDASCARLDQLTAGLAPYDAARAAVLQYVSALVRELLAIGRSGDKPFGRLKKSLAETHAIRARFPDSLDAAKVAIASVPFAEDAEAAFAEVEAPMPNAAADDPDFALDRATMELGLVARFGDTRRLPRARAVVEEAARAHVSRAEVALLEGDLASLSGGWPEAQTAYERALASVEGAKRARALNNAGVAMLHRGDAVGAQRRWAEAVAAHKDGALAGCNAAMQLATTDAGRAEARTRLEEGKTCGYPALAALVGIAKASHAPRAKLKELAASAVQNADERAVTAQSPAYVAGRYLPSSSTFQLAFGAKPAPGDGRRYVFPLVVAVRPTLWLAVPPAVDESELRRLAKGTR